MAKFEQGEKFTSIFSLLVAILLDRHTVYLFGKARSSQFAVNMSLATLSNAVQTGRAALAVPKKEGESNAKPLGKT